MQMARQEQGPEPSARPQDEACWWWAWCSALLVLVALAGGCGGCAEEDGQEEGALSEDCANDGVDDDGDGWSDCDDPDCGTWPACQGQPEHCYNGIDDDGDGQIDCQDTICDGRFVCEPRGEDCVDGVDNDGDAQADCRDEDCASTAACLPEGEVCTNGQDDDGDGLADCQDTSCGQTALCLLRAEICDDGADGDQDGLIDCQDEDCARTSVCLPRGEDCRDARDNDGDGRIDCADVDCAYTWHCLAPREDCGNRIDDNGDGQIDCDDLRCLSTPTCLGPGREDCDNMIDDDGDNATDCEDSDCVLSLSCRELVRPLQEICQGAGDENDDDGDGRLGCDDPDCQLDSTCVELCDNDLDDDGDGWADCDDPSCEGVCGAAPGPDCRDADGDHDNDGAVGCDESACFLRPDLLPRRECLTSVICPQPCPSPNNCPTPTHGCDDPLCYNTISCRQMSSTERCMGGFDEDRDGLVDCADPDCSQACAGARIMPAEPAGPIRDPRPLFIGSIAGAPMGSMVRIALAPTGPGIDVSLDTTTAPFSYSGMLRAALGEGDYTYTVTVTDPVTSRSVSATESFSVDLTGPMAPLIDQPAHNSVLSDVLPTISGSAEAGAMVSVEIRGANGVVFDTTTTAAASGIWSATPTNPLAAGVPYSVVATATDAAGNTSAETIHDFSIDASLPSITIAQPTSGSATRNGTVTISGTTSLPGATVVVEVRDTQGTPVFSDSLTADANGAWSTTTSALSDGIHTATATVTTATGLTSSRTVTFAVDTMAPPPPSITTPAAGATIADSSPTISGTAEPGARVSVSVSDSRGLAQSQCAATVTADAASGSWAHTCSRALADGTYVAEAAATDAAGNTGSSATRMFTVDTMTKMSFAITSPAELRRVYMSPNDSLVVSGVGAYTINPYMREIRLTEPYGMVTSSMTGWTVQPDGAWSGSVTPSGYLYMGAPPSYTYSLTATDSNYDGMSSDTQTDTVAAFYIHLGPHSCDYAYNSSGTEHCTNGIDETGFSPMGTTGADCAQSTCRGPLGPPLCQGWTAAEDTSAACSDLADNDGDGLIDCDDPDCGMFHYNYMSGSGMGSVGLCGEDCQTIADDDGDGDPNCGDSECWTEGACTAQAVKREMNCGNQAGGSPIDDDGDGLANCADPDCQDSWVCKEMNCADGDDNDGDRRTDCDDPDCAGRLACLHCSLHDNCFTYVSATGAQVSTQESCQDGVDDDADGRADCADPDCFYQAACLQEGTCAPGSTSDSDGDGLAGCADPDCKIVPACGLNTNTTEHCYNFEDDNCDGLVDCEDAMACGTSPACAPGCTSTAAGCGYRSPPPL